MQSQTVFDLEGRGLGYQGMKKGEQIILGLNFFWPWNLVQDLEIPCTTKLRAPEYFQPRILTTMGTLSHTDPLGYSSLKWSYGWINVGRGRGRRLSFMRIQISCSWNWWHLKDYAKVFEAKINDWTGVSLHAQQEQRQCLQSVFMKSHWRDFGNSLFRCVFQQEWIEGSFGQSRQCISYPIWYNKLP